MSQPNKRKPSAKRAESNRRNAQKSTGPRTPQGKQQVRLDAIKHGLNADPFVRGMLALHEDPRPYYRLLGDLLASLRPANPNQRLQVEDIARLRVEKQRLQRARAALIAGKMRGLELERDRRLLDFDCEAPDLPQAELLRKGLDRAPDSPPKFEKMLACFDVVITQAKQGEWRLDPEPELNLLYGQEPSLEGAYLRNVFRRFVAAQKGSTENQKAKIENSEGAPGESERLLLLRTLFAAKQRALRLYQLYNREFVEISPDQRDGCFAPSDRTDVNLMREEAQNDRQLRLALNVYWQTQKEDAARSDQIGARASQPCEESEEADRLVAELLSALSVMGSEHSEPRTPNSEGLAVSSPMGAGMADVFDAKQSQQVIENTEEVSGIGQNKANLGVADGPLRRADFEAGVAAPLPLDDLSAVGHRKSSIKGSMEAARPRVKELLEQMQSDPEARALVETFLLSRMVEEESCQEEQELAALQREKQKREALEKGLEQMVTAQQELESRNRRLRAQMGASELAHQQVREQVKPAEAVVATRREPTHQEIYNKIRDVVGLGGPEEFYSDEVKGVPAYYLREREYLEQTQGRGRASEQEPTAKEKTGGEETQ